MNSSVTISRIGWHFIIIISIVLTLFTASSAFSLNKNLSFNLNNQTMSEVAKQISQQLDHKVLMDDELATTRVSGHFDNITLEDFLTRRVFRGKNIVILFDDKQRTVRISSLGQGNHHTEYNNTTSRIKRKNDMDLEVTEGVLRRDVIPNENSIDPMDLEVTEGVIRRDVLSHSDNTDPMDLEMTEGMVRRDVIPNENNIDPMDFEMTEGVIRRSVKAHSSNVEPIDLDVTEGVKRRDLLVH